MTSFSTVSDLLSQVEYPDAFSLGVALGAEMPVVATVYMVSERNLTRQSTAMEPLKFTDHFRSIVD